MALGLQYHSRIILNNGLVLDSGDCAVEFLGRYVIWLCLSCGCDVFVRVGAVPCVTLRTIFCRKMVRTITAIVCDCSELLLQHFWVSFWWNPHCAVHWRRWKQDLFINIYYLFSVNCCVYIFYTHYTQSKEENIEIQTILIPPVQTSMETEVQHL